MPNSPHLPALITLAVQEMPLLRYDIDNNVSSIYNAQKMLQRLHLVLTYLLEHTILEDCEAAGIDPQAALAQLRGPSQTAPQAAAPAGHNPAVLPQQNFPANQGVGSLPPLIPPVTNVIVGQTITNVAATEPGPSDVAEVVITAGGTKVIPPRGAGPVREFAPGQIADTTFAVPAPAKL